MSRALLVLSILALPWRAVATNQSTNVLGKVTELLQQMKTKSESLQQEANTEHAEVLKVCQQTESAKQAAASSLSLQLNDLEAELAQSEVDLADLRGQTLEQQFMFGNATFELQQLQAERSRQATTFAQDLTEYNAAIGAIDRALELLAAEKSTAGGAAGGAAGAAFLSVHSKADRFAPAVAMAQSVARKLRQKQSYQPDSGGMAKDEHLFDEFDGLSTASGHYESQSGGIEQVLEDLKNTFTSERNTLMDNEKTSRSTFEAEEQLLQKQIEDSRTGMVASRGEVEAKEAEHADKQQQMQDTSLNLNATQAYIAQLKQACDEKDKAYVEIKAMRAQEINALDSAIQLITGAVPQSSAKHFPSLLRMRVTAGSRFVGRRGDDGAGKILGFLRTKSRILKSASLGKIAGEVAELIGEASESAGSEDPLAKVKAMIEDLITQLQASATEEATHNAWCEAEIAKNEKARQGSEADIKKHNTAIVSYETEIPKLAMETQELNETLAAAGPFRTSMVENRSTESRMNLITVEDAESSAEAIESAILLLEQFYANVSKGVALSQQQAPLPDVRGAQLVASHTADGVAALHLKQAPTPSPAAAGGDDIIPVVVAGAPIASAPQSGAASGVIAMLKVAASDFRKLAEKTKKEEAEAQQLHNEVITDHDVMVVSAQKDRDFKMEEQRRLETELDAARLDLNASSQELADAEAAYEQLKPPCLNVETYEERKAKRDAEIAALQEAYDMLEQYAEESGGTKTKLLQEVHKESVAKHDVQLEQGRNDPEQTRQIADLLDEIRNEVIMDLEDDTRVYNEMVAWCTETIAVKQSAIADAQTREEELVQEIETSAQEKASLEVQIRKLEEDIEEQTNSLKVSASMRQKDEDAFRASEVELMESIAALKHALVVLKKHFGEGAGEERDYASEQAELESHKTSANLTLVAAARATISPHSHAAATQDDTQLVAVVAELKRTLGVLPGSDAMLASLSPRDGTTLRAFLDRPEELLSESGHSALGQRSRASLVSQSSQMNAGVDGGTVYGILSQLLETFQADLEEARAKEESDKSSHVALQASKSNQIETLLASLTMKREQLAHFMVVNAEANEDYAYNKAAREADSEYLISVQTQCRDSDYEFQTRNSTRHSEIEALDEAIAILTASSGNEGGTSSADSKGKAANFFLHHSVAVGTGRVFRRNHSASSVANLANLSTNGTVELVAHHADATAAASNGTDVVSSSATSGQLRMQTAAATTSVVLAAARRTSSGAVRPQRMPANGTSQLVAVHPQGKVGLPRIPDKVLATEAQRMREARDALSKLAMRTQMHDGKQITTLLALQAATMGPLTTDALKAVVSKIDGLKTTLLEEKKLELRMHDTCIAEENSADQQLERRITDESNLNNTQTRLQAEVTNLENEIADLQAEIQAINASVVHQTADRKQEYAEFRLSVEQQRSHQQKLLTAVQALKSFYSANPGMAALLELRTIRAAGDAAMQQEPKAAGQKLIRSRVGTPSDSELALSRARPAKTSLVLVRRNAAYRQHGAERRSQSPSKQVAAAPAPAAPAPAAPTPATPAPAPPGLRVANRVDRSAYETEQSKPDGFTKPMTAHEGSVGILSILEMLVDQSQQLVEQLIRAEMEARDGQVLSMNDARASVEAKEREIVGLDETLGVAQAELQQVGISIGDVQTEMAEINAFLEIVKQKCDHLVANFADSQEARSAELERLDYAKQTLMGMVEE